MRYLLTISFLFIQLFAASFHADAKEGSMPAKEFAAPQTGSIQSSDVAWDDAFLAGNFFKISPSRNHQSFPQQAIEKFGAAGCFASTHIRESGVSFVNKRSADLHTPLALLLLFPKHYFW